MDYPDLNVLLKRSLRPGERYERYFKKNSCEPTYLRKGDTAFTVKQMQKWAYKKAGHTKALTLGEFKGKTLYKTCQAIYEFLFHHIQYELDGTKQNLKSPACTWATRQEGTDCKSYSVFASTILINLGIKHYFRRVKQPNGFWPNEGVDPNLWSHVYVVVPLDQRTLKVKNPQDYYVIDPTVSDNKEVRYTHKSDTLMSKVNLPHYGLGSPSLKGMGGCTCTPKSTPMVTTTTLPAPKPVISRPKTAVIPKSAPSPRSISTTPTPRVIRRAPSPRSTFTTTSTPTTIRTVPLTRVREISGSSPRLRNSGTHLDPRSNRNIPIGDALRSPGLGRGLVYNPYSNQRTGGSSGNTKTQDWAQFGSSVINAAQQGAAQNRSATQYGTREERLNAIGKSGATSATFQAVGAGAAAYTYGISAILTLIPSEWYENKIGQLFEGWDCIGSSWTPKTAKQTFVIEAEYIKARAAQTLQELQGKTFAEVELLINQFWEYFYNVQSGSRRWLGDSAKDCTRRGLQLLVKSLDELKKRELEPAFLKAVSAAGHILVKAGTKKVTYAQNPDNGYPNGHPPYTIDVPQYKIKVNHAVLQPEEQNALAIHETNKPKSVQAGFGTTGFLTLAALAAGTYLYMN